MIERQPSMVSGEVTVIFGVPAEPGIDQVSLVGDFNEWSPEVHPMERDSDGDGAFTVSVPLPADRAYRFRYLFGDGRWENDWTADAYVSNEFGSEDSVVDLTNPEPLDAQPRQPGNKKSSTPSA